MKGEKRFIDPMDAPDIKTTNWYKQNNPETPVKAVDEALMEVPDKKSTRWYQEKNLDATVENVTDEDLDIEAIAARNETPNLKEKMAAEIAAENRAENKEEYQKKTEVKSIVESIEINAEAPSTPEVVIAKAESSLFSRFSSGMRDVVSKAASAYESLKNVGTIDTGEGKRIEVGARATVTDMKRGVADFFADMRSTLFGGTEKKTIDALQQDEETQGWQETEVEVDAKYPGLFGEIIARLPDAPATVKSAFLAVAVDVPKGIYDSWKRDKALNASLEQTLKEEYGEDYTLDMWRAKEAADKLEFTPDAIRARQAAQDEAYYDGIIEAPSFMQTLRQDVVTIVGAGSEAMKSMHIAIGRAAKFAFYEEPMDLLRGYGMIAETIASDVKRGAEAAKGKGKEAAEGAKNAAISLKEGVNKLQTKAEKAFSDYKEKTWGAKAKRDAESREIAVDRLIEFGGVKKMTETQRDTVVAKRIMQLEDQIAALRQDVESGQAHKEGLVIALERIQSNNNARAETLEAIKRSIATKGEQVDKKTKTMVDLQHLLNAYTENVLPMEIAANDDGAIENSVANRGISTGELSEEDEVTEEMPKPTEKTA